MAGLCRNIKVLRASLALSQSALAQKIGVSRTSIVDWENGDTTPNLNATVALASLAGVTLDTFVNGSLVKDEANEIAAQRS